MNDTKPNKIKHKKVDKAFARFRAASEAWHAAVREREAAETVESAAKRELCLAEREYTHAVNNRSKP